MMDDLGMDMDYVCESPASSRPSTPPLVRDAILDGYVCDSPRSVRSLLRHSQNSSFDRDTSNPGTPRLNRSNRGSHNRGDSMEFTDRPMTPHFISPSADAGAFQFPESGGRGSRTSSVLDAGEQGLDYFIPPPECSSYDSRGDPLSPGVYSDGSPVPMVFGAAPPVPASFSTDDPIPPPPMPACFSSDAAPPPPPPMPTTFSTNEDPPPPPPPMPTTFSGDTPSPRPSSYAASTPSPGAYSAFDPPTPSAFSVTPPTPSAFNDSPVAPMRNKSRSKSSNRDSLESSSVDSPGTPKSRKRVSSSTDYRRKFSAPHTSSGYSLPSPGMHSGVSSASESALASPDHYGEHPNFGFQGRKGQGRSSGMNQDEYVYGLVLQSVINPLGAPDPRKGNRPADLAEHLRTVFGVDRDQHEQRVRDVQHTKPSNVVLNVSVLEAKDLSPSKNATSDPYCVLAVVKPKSPRNSPRNSPAARRKHSSIDHGDVKQTQAIKATLSPRWNENFEMDIKDLPTEDLQLMIFNSDTDSSPAKSSGVKGLFKQLKYSLESGKAGSSFHGQCRVPVRNIPASGWEKWFPLFKETSSRNPQPVGQVKLRLGLAIKQSVYQLDAAESELCSLEDFYAMVHRLYLHAIMEVSGDESSPSTGVFSELPVKSKNILHQFAVQNRFSKLHRLLMEMIVILDLVGGNIQCQVDDKLIKDSIVSLEMEWFQVTGGKVDQLDKGVVSDAQFMMFNKSATEYVSQMIRGLKESHSIPTLFPPQQLRLAEINKRVSVAVSLLNLHLWTTTDRARKDASGLLAERLQDDVRNWLNEKLETIEGSSKDQELDETRQLVEIVQDTCSALAPIYSVSNYFQRLNVDYYKIASLAVDGVISNRAQQLMLRMDRYQVRYHKFIVNIRDSSTATLQLYFVLRNLFTVVRENINSSKTEPEELFMVTVGKYQSWFEHAVMFWLQTFKEECVKRMQKALEIDKDKVVQVTSLVKYSNSSVDVISCFSKITTEWKQIDFEDADIAVLGVTKITDTICDGARAYTEQIHSILENNGYYDFIDNEIFDVTDQLCVTLNNISHVQTFLFDLRQLLNWEIVCENMSIKHENEKIGENSLRVLEDLVESAVQDVLARGKLLLVNITEKMSVDIKRLTKRFTQKYPEKKSSIDCLIGYLDTSLDTLYEKLEANIFPLMLEQIWYVLLYAFVDTLLHGQSTTYYQTMSEHLQTLKQYVLRGTDECTVDCEVYQGLVEELTANAMTSEQLQLQYYTKLCENNTTTPGLFFGHLAVKLAYQLRLDENDKVDILLKVDSANHLPGMSRSNTSNPFVSVRLSPHSRFHGSKLQRTEVVKGSVDPDFNSVFFYPGIEEDSLNLPGAVAIFTVWSHESVLPDDFLGELVVPLSHAREMNHKQTLDDIAAIILPLQRPAEPTDGPYKVLRERASHDKHAKAIVNKRRETAGWATPNILCGSFHSALSKMMGKKTGVEGQKYGPSTC